jgi:ribosomal protein L37AE/L43A
VVANRTSIVYSMVKEAGEKILRTKFCFSCQKDKSIEAGKKVLRGRSLVWRCGDCAAKKSPMGFSKATKEKK